jgi:Ser/Thr protein kinase RdoA (MazF antagonist)
MSDFDRLQPEIILEAIEAAGYRTTGEYSQLNSYENRVFDIRLEEPISSHNQVGESDQINQINQTNMFGSPLGVNPGNRIIAKFYRPNRWSSEAIRDEHEFLFDLKNEGIPAVAPLPILNPRRAAKGPYPVTTLNFEGFELALFPRISGRMPDEFLAGQLRQVGRTLALIHNIGARRPAKHRVSLNATNYGRASIPKLSEFVYPELWHRYEDVCEVVFDYLDYSLDESNYIRLHGDCHKGNLLLTGSGEFFFVDFDDFCNGPTVQDFWMLLSGSVDEETTGAEQDEICAGYEELRDIPDEWHLFEPLRALRIINYAGWISNRWDDPFFKQIFPAFTTYNYWVDELNRLEKIANQL